LGQSIIFARTKNSASELHRKLAEDGFKCTSIQGGLSHEERDQVIKEFRSGLTKILIATDVLARGFDQAQVTLVVNYDIPTKSAEPHDPDYELYLHRIGRSGRFGRKGAAFNLIANDRDERNVNLIEQHFNRVIPEVRMKICITSPPVGL
jgi:ATP-dependent RNA helicase DDX19/DBP5